VSRATSTRATLAPGARLANVRARSVARRKPGSPRPRRDGVQSVRWEQASRPVSSWHHWRVAKGERRLTSGSGALGQEAGVCSPDRYPDSQNAGSTGSRGDSRAAPTCRSPKGRGSASARPSRREKPFSYSLRSPGASVSNRSPSTTSGFVRQSPCDPRGRSGWRSEPEPCARRLQGPEPVSKPNCGSPFTAAPARGDARGVLRAGRPPAGRSGPRPSPRPRRRR
jgi:hypothetical protein